ncbi:signal peptide, CUB and EGF-like domain-containing protein 2 [Gadus chalcogrammus]|uniref:signal peptide, CUB and EGF-like domain-containing protein 2 n=1 Tax=Gadus chalcogrammus TaxID=1042646 RepID=UPI0024C49776|nr:signal peptide, CUB and EGF-like domain-containing protein 2 [Gadus chalcogrammus]
MQSETDLGWCSEGTYVSYHGCLECTTGHFCPGNVSAPHKCPPGTFNFYTGRSSIGDCKPCSHGLISSEDRADCRPCPAGFSCHPGNSTLSACPKGQHSPEGVVLCLACPIGSVCPSGHPQKCDPGGEPDSERTGCVDCPPGFYSTPCTVRCVKCPSGPLPPL